MWFIKHFGYDENKPIKKDYWLTGSVALAYSKNETIN